MNDMPLMAERLKTKEPFGQTKGFIFRTAGTT